MDDFKAYICDCGRKYPARAYFDCERIEVKSIFGLTKSINKTSIIDYTNIYYGYNEVVCIRYSQNGRTDTLCILTSPLTKTTEMLEIWRINKSTPAKMRIAVPEDSGKRLSKISKGGISAVVIMFAMFPVISILSSMLFGGNVGMVITLVYSFSYVGVGAIANAPQFWALKNHVKYAKPLDGQKAEPTDGEILDNRFINILTLAGMAVLLIISLVCVLLFMVYAFNSSAASVNIFAVWGVGVFSSALMFVLWQARKRIMKK